MSRTKHGRRSARNKKRTRRVQYGGALQRSLYTVKSVDAKGTLSSSQDAIDQAMNNIESENKRLNQPIPDRSTTEVVVLQSQRQFGSDCKLYNTKSNAMIDLTNEPLITSQSLSALKGGPKVYYLYIVEFLDAPGPNNFKYLQIRQSVAAKVQIAEYAQEAKMPSSKGDIDIIQQVPTKAENKAADATLRTLQQAVQLPLTQITKQQPIQTILLEEEQAPSPASPEFQEINTILDSPELELDEQDEFTESTVKEVTSQLNEDEVDVAGVWTDIIRKLGDSFKQNNQVSATTMREIEQEVSDSNLDSELLDEIIKHFEANFPKSAPKRHATSKSLIQTVHTRRPGYAKPKPSEILYEREAEFQAINTNPFLAKSRSSVTCNCALCRKENTTAYASRECRACRKGPCKQVGSQPYPRHLYDEWWQSVGKY